MGFNSGFKGLNGKMKSSACSSNQYLELFLDTQSVHTATSQRITSSTLSLPDTFATLAASGSVVVYYMLGQPDGNRAGNLRHLVTKV